MLLGLKWLTEAKNKVPNYLGGGKKKHPKHTPKID